MKWAKAWFWWAVEEIKLGYRRGQERHRREHLARLFRDYGESLRRDRNRDR